MTGTFANREVVLGVTGSIAAYKACELASRLVEYGAKVTAVLTRSAQEFVGAATFEALTGRRVITELFAAGQEAEIAHIAVARRADLFLIAPASANILAKAAHGLADDWLSTALLATQAPVLFAPAMNMHMYAHPATHQNLEILRGRGCRFVGPAAGNLACGDVGPGRLAEPAEIMRAAADILAGSHGAFSLEAGAQDLAGRRILITSGPTREPLDPVRYIGNRSSGKMGRALALDALRRGAEVTVVTGPVQVALPEGAEVVRVETAQEMLEAVRARFEACDVFIAAAAVADYRPEMTQRQKHKRDGAPLELRLLPNPDIAAEMGLRRRPGQVLAGFAAETEHLLEHAREKLLKKGLDLLLANAVGGEEDAIGADDSRAWLLDADGGIKDLGLVPKLAIAHAMLDAVAQRLAGNPQESVLM